MSADSFHHQVELSLKRMVKIYDFSDFITAVSTAQKGKVDIKEMTVGDFYDWQDWSSASQIKKCQPRPYLRNVVHVVAKRGQYTVSYKSSFSASEDEFLTLNFLSAKALANGIPMAAQHDKARGITVCRKADVLNELCPLMPAGKRAFWQNLPTSDGGDDGFCE
jgi:hypothetical protein